MTEIFSVNGWTGNEDGNGIFSKIYPNGNEYSIWGVWADRFFVDVKQSDGQSRTIAGSYSNPYEPMNLLDVANDDEFIFEPTGYIEQKKQDEMYGESDIFHHN